MNNVTLLKSFVAKDEVTGRWLGRVMVDVGEFCLFIEHPWFAEEAAKAWCETLERQFYGDTTVFTMTIRKPLIKRLWVTLRSMSKSVLLGYALLLIGALLMTYLLFCVNTAFMP